MNKNQNNELISEIALRLADVQYKDFEYNVYEQALLRADRMIAKKYQVITKMYSAVLEEQKEVILNLDNFKAEYLVAVDDKPLVKVTHRIEDLMEYCYYLEVLDDKLRFAYKLSNTIDLADESTTSDSKHDVVILYTVIPDSEDYTDNNYVIDNKYDEERILHAMEYLAKIGVAKFSGDKKAKYIDILKMVTRNDDYDKRVIKDNAWISVRPFHYI